MSTSTTDKEFQVPSSFALGIVTGITTALILLGVTSQKQLALFVVALNVAMYIALIASAGVARRNPKFTHSRYRLSLIFFGAIVILSLLFLTCSIDIRFQRGARWDIRKMPAVYVSRESLLFRDFLAQGNVEDIDFVHVPGKDFGPRTIKEVVLVKVPL